MQLQLFLGRPRDDLLNLAESGPTAFGRLRRLSRLDQNAKSQVGAIGVMQIMPATGAELNVGNINQVEPNIHGGVKYMRHLQDEFFKDEPIDPLNKLLLTFASYNAGPGRVRQLRREAAERGLNPNVWFGNVEQIA